MLKNSLDYLKSTSKKFSKDKGIFDIILYGSSIREEEYPRDIDILIIFKDKKLEERLNIAQKFKEKIKNKIKNIDVKTINLKELFDKRFLARQGIISEGYSLLYSSFFSENMGFKGYMLFTYNLKNLDKTKKTRFIYSLSGRNTKGIIELTGAEHIGKGAVIVPIEKSAVFEDLLKQWEIKYKNRKMLLER